MLWLISGSASSQIIPQSYHPNMVKEINPGSVDGCLISSFAPLVPFKNGVFFSGSDGMNGLEPWFSDGTNAGTIMLANIAPGAGNSSPQFLAIINNVILFAATDPINGTELWKTDGTPSGTSLLYQVAPGAIFDQGVNHKLDTLNNMLLFWGTTSTSGKELYRTDGTTAGTIFLGDINPGPIGTGNNVLPNVQITRSSGKLFFRGTGLNSTSDAELVVTDGTPSGTQILEINSNGSSYPFIFAEINGVVYFEATTAATGYELWKSDGTTGGTSLYHEFIPGSSPSQSSIPEAHTAMSISGARGFFRINGTSRELYRLDGGAAGITLIKRFQHYTGLHQSIKFNNIIYFNASDSALVYGSELWKTDLTQAGTVMVKDINPGTGSSYPKFHGIVNNTLIIEAYHNTYGRELWRSNGTSLNTTLIKNIKPNVSFELMAGPKVMYGTNKFIFTVDYNNMDPWITDGTTNGTFALKNSGFVFYAKNYYSAAGKVFFTGNQNIDDQELYVTDGTLAGTKLVKDVNPPTPGLDPITDGFVASGNHLFYNFRTPSSGSELWQLQFSNRQNAVVHLRNGDFSDEITVDALNAFPNPSSDRFHVQLDEKISGILVLDLKDITGKTVFMRTYESLPDENLVEMNLSGFENGMYILHLTAPDYRKTCRLVKQ